MIERKIERNFHLLKALVKRSFTWALKILLLYPGTDALGQAVLFFARCLQSLSESAGGGNKNIALNVWINIHTSKTARNI